MNRRALTLIEVMATVAIVSVLMVSVMRITARLARSQAAARIGQDAVPESHLRRLLEADVCHAERYGRPADGDGFALVTRNAATESMEFEHVPTRVEYRLFNADDCSYLIRRQETSEGKVSTEIVCRGAVSIGLVDGDSQPLVMANGNTRPVPAVVGVVVELTPGAPVKWMFRTQWP